jgi:hypothetical protein
MATRWVLTKMNQSDATTITVTMTSFGVMRTPATFLGPVPVFTPVVDIARHNLPASHSCLYTDSSSLSTPK